MSDYEIKKPVANPQTAEPGDVVNLTCNIIPSGSVLEYAYVDVYIYEGSILPGHGTLLASYRQQHLFSSGVPRTIYITHVAQEGTTDRRDVRVRIVNMENVEREDREWDDVFYVQEVEIGDFVLGKPVATPASTTPGNAITIVCPITPPLSEYADVEVTIYEGSIFPGHGALIAKYTQEVLLIINHTSNVYFTHIAQEGTTDRRDVRVRILNEATGEEQADEEWDDIFYVEEEEEPEEPGEVTFEGAITNVILKPGSDAGDIRFLVSFTAHAINWWDGFGWETRLTAVMGSLSFEDKQNHVGADGSRTNQEVVLGSIAPGYYTALFTLAAKGLAGAWQTLDTRPLTVQVQGQDGGDGEEPEEPEEGEGKFPWGPTAVIAGGALILVAAFEQPGRKKPPAY